MQIEPELPDDIDALKQLIVARTAERDAAKAGLIIATLEVDKLKFELARLKRSSFGQSSERIERQIEQLELKLEEIETGSADCAAPPVPLTAEDTSAPAPRPRRALPSALTRTTEVHEPSSCACPRCGTEQRRKVGEDVSEVLTYIPARFEVVRKRLMNSFCRFGTNWFSLARCGFGAGSGHGSHKKLFGGTAHGWRHYDLSGAGAR